MIAALRDQQLRIKERLLKVYSGVRGQTMGMDMDCSPTVLPTVARIVDSLSDALQASFDMPWEAFIPLIPDPMWEYD